MPILDSSHIKAVSAVELNRDDAAEEEAVLRRTTGPELLFVRVVSSGSSQFDSGL